MSYFVVRLNDPHNFHLRAEILQFFSERGVSTQTFCNDVLFGEDAVRARKCGCFTGESQCEKCVRERTEAGPAVSHSLPEVRPEELVPKEIEQVTVVVRPDTPVDAPSQNVESNLNKLTETVTDKPDVIALSPLPPLTSSTVPLDSMDESGRMDLRTLDIAALPQSDLQLILKVIAQHPEMLIGMDDPSLVAAVRGRLPPTSITDLLEPITASSLQVDEPMPSTPPQLPIKRTSFTPSYNRTKPDICWPVQYSSRSTRGATVYRWVSERFPGRGLEFTPLTSSRQGAMRRLQCAFCCAEREAHRRGLRPNHPGTIMSVRADDTDYWDHPDELAHVCGFPHNHRSDIVNVLTPFAALQINEYGHAHIGVPEVRSHLTTTFGFLSDEQKDQMVDRVMESLLRLRNQKTTKSKAGKTAPRASVDPVRLDMPGKYHDDTAERQEEMEQEPSTSPFDELHSDTSTSRSSSCFSHSALFDPDMPVKREPLDESMSDSLLPKRSRTEEEGKGEKAGGDRTSLLLSASPSHSACKLCGKQVARATRSRHVLTHTQLPARYRCRVCSAQYQYAQKCREHVCAGGVGATKAARLLKKQPLDQWTPDMHVLLIDKTHECF